MCIRDRQYAERFRERTLEERFYMSTRNLFYMLEGSELDEQAAWAIENTKEWYRAGEYPGAVSYTHLDVYKRQDQSVLIFLLDFLGGFLETGQHGTLAAGQMLA